MQNGLQNLESILPANICEVLRSLVLSAEESFGADLTSLILFGSAAEGKLRATSDINLLFILERFDQNKADSFRQPLRVAYAAVKLSAMFALRSELEAAFEVFAVKFADISLRHRVLCGQDLLAGLTAPRKARLLALRQSLLNLSMRLRERYIATSLREEQLALVIAETAPPLRAAAASVLELEGRQAPSPKEALAILTASIPGGPWDLVLQNLSHAREARSMEPGTASATAADLIKLSASMRDYVERIV